MKNNSLKLSLADKVLNKLRSGRFKMRPKIYFILKSILIVTGVMVAALFALYLVSLIGFALQVRGMWYLPGFGFRGVRTFIISLPWLLILISVFLIVVLEIFVKRFTFAYRRPILYSLLAIIILVLLGSFIIGKTRLHPSLFWRAQERRLPAAGRLYRDFGMMGPSCMHRGIVSEIKENGFCIETPQGEILTVIITPKTRSQPKADIRENDMVVVMGERDNGTVQAFGVRKIDDDLNIPLRRHMRMPPNK